MEKERNEKVWCKNKKAFTFLFKKQKYNPKTLICPGLSFFFPEVKPIAA
jgi:hypothetical protein